MAAARAESGASRHVPRSISSRPDPSSTPARVIVAGGGVAAVETLLALRDSPASESRRRSSRPSSGSPPAPWRWLGCSREGTRVMSSSPRSRTRSSATAWPRSIPMLVASAARAGKSSAMTTSCSPSAQGRAQRGAKASHSARIPPRRRCTACSRRSSEATWGRSRSSSPGAARCGRSRSTSWPSWPPGRLGAWAWIRCGSRWSPRRSARSRCSAALRARPSGSCSTAAASSSSARPTRPSAAATCSSIPPGGGWTACGSSARRCWMAQTCRAFPRIPRASSSPTRTVGCPASPASMRPVTARRFRSSRAGLPRSRPTPSPRASRRRLARP